MLEVIFSSTSLNFFNSDQENCIETLFLLPLFRCTMSIRKSIKRSFQKLLSKPFSYFFRGKIPEKYFQRNYYLPIRLNERETNTLAACLLLSSSVHLLLLHFIFLFLPQTEDNREERVLRLGDLIKANEQAARRSTNEGRDDAQREENEAYLHAARKRHGRSVIAQ